MVILSLWVCIPLVSLCCGALAFVMKRKHLLNLLLSLEFIMVSIFWFMLSVVGFLGGDSFFLMFFLTLAACEGALGLALLVSIVRSHGSDNFNSFSILGC
ncbi:NADH dehydrogenase subunit 4L (mitochondrion) [Palaemon carinicauda]|uniref:NADH-ubiquinone oxidoreductase chain 4L n=1 Tax=Palaemon carinicauda TaxID=392227 RepID=C1I1Z1_PALCI|nr:NADH dehydrogenase subunit 4L [Palaemon carinicauda]ABQ63420.1 NADH dehydrogenase subunit 4L [Palaemon carinicauda]